MSWRSASSSRSRNRYFTPEHRLAGRCLCGLALSPGRMMKTMITTTSLRLSTTWATHGGQHAPSAERDVDERQNREDPGQSQPRGPQQRAVVVTARSPELGFPGVWPGPEHRAL